LAPTAQTRAPSLSHSPRQDRIARAGHGHDDVGVGGLAVGLGRLGAEPLAERPQPLLGPAIRDDAVERRDGGPDALHLGLGLEAAADDAERSASRAREVPGGDAARRAGAQPAQVVGLDHRGELAPGGVEQHDHERRPRIRRGIGLEAGQLELPVNRGHHRQGAAVEALARARPVVRRASGKAMEALLDRLERVLRREERLDVALGQVQRHRAAV
jgi:hypothetical protein